MQPNPLQVALYEQFASGRPDFATVVGPVELSASGPDCVQTLAEKLLQAGYAPGREMVLDRHGEIIGRTTIAQAALNKEYTLPKPPVRPLVIAMSGEEWATFVGLRGCDASGPDCVRTLARYLLRRGYAPEHEVVIERDFKKIGRTTLAAASQRE